MFISMIAEDLGYILRPFFDEDYPSDLWRVVLKDTDFTVQFISKVQYDIIDLIDYYEKLNCSSTEIIKNILILLLHYKQESYPAESFMEILEDWTTYAPEINKYLPEIKKLLLFT